jgi:hypothetical protein
MTAYVNVLHVYRAAWAIGRQRDRPQPVCEILALCVASRTPCWSAALIRSMVAGLEMGASADNSDRRNG